MLERRKSRRHVRVGGTCLFVDKVCLYTYVGVWVRLCGCICGSGVSPCVSKY
jgi:hypothetical protein